MKRSWNWHVQGGSGINRSSWALPTRHQLTLERKPPFGVEWFTDTGWHPLDKCVGVKGDIKRVTIQTQLQLDLQHKQQEEETAAGRLRKLSSCLIKVCEGVREDRVAVPDRCPSKSKFLTTSPCSPSAGVWGWAVSARHNNQSQIQTRAPQRWAAATNECLNVSRQLCKHADNEREASFFCIQQHLSSLFRAHHRAACVWNWISPRNRWKLNSFNQGE